MAFNFAFFMDLAILVLLAATVFLAFRLSVNLRHFRESKSDMEGLVNRLTSNIERAEKAISGMQNSAQTSGTKLQEIINQSKFLADELQFMNEAGNKLAERLEKLADKNRALVTEMESAANSGPSPISFKQHEPFAPESQDDVDTLGFMIQDREYEEENYTDLGFDDEEPVAFQSQAERELYEALYKKGRKSGVGRA